MYSMKTHSQYPGNPCPLIPQSHLYLSNIYNARPSTSNQCMVVYPQGVRCPQYQPEITVQPQRRLNASETAPQLQPVQGTQLNDRIVDLTFKLGESQAKERTLKNQEEEMNRELQNISQRLDATTYALRSGEITMKLQAKEIEMLRKSNEQLIKKNIDLTVKAENASLALVEKTELVDEQSMEIADFKGKQDTQQKKNEDLSDQIVDLTFKLGEYQAKERTLKKQKDEMDRQLQEMSQRLDSTIVALKTEEHITRLQAKEIEMMKGTIDQLNEKRIALKSDAQNAFLALDNNSRLVQVQVLQLADLKDKYHIVQRENEEWKSKYQGILRSIEQDTYSMEQFSNVLKNVLINNDLILENLKGIQTDPEEKKMLMVGHSETHRLLREQEMMNQRVRQLEKQFNFESTHY